MKIINNFIEKNKKVIFFIGLFLILICAIIFVKRFDSKEKEEFNMIGINSNVEIRNEEDDVDSKIIIHITGEVKKEGIIKIEEGGRISDAIEEAGGLTENADINRINLAYELEDGQKIYIPNKKDKAVDNYIEEGVDNIVLESDETGKSSSNLININKATVEELQSLNGIGESLAMSIVSYREENGKYKSIEDIKNVSGIGENKYLKIKDSIKVK